MNNELVFNNNLVNLLRYNLTQKIFLQLSNIDYAVVKGEPLSMLAYNKFGLRTSCDIDLLISRKSLSQIETLLLENGYSSESSRKDRILCLSGSHQIPPYYKKIEGFTSIIDVNFDIFWGEYTGNRVNMDEFLSDTIEMDIHGCKVKTLCPLKSMVQLILHHYKEMNSIYLLTGHNPFNINLFNDIYYLLKNNQEDISISRLYDISAKYNISPYVFYILYFTYHVFKDDLIKEYVEEFRTPYGEELLNYYGLADKERKMWKVDFKTRLNTKNIYQLIKEDLTQNDLKKLEYNKRIFR